MEILEWFVLLVFISFLIYPIGHCLYYKVPNKLFFLSSIAGISFVVHSLLAIAIAPLALAMIKIVPQLAENGVVGNILPVLWLIEVVHDHYFIVLTPVLCIGLPHIIRKRYAMFT